MSEEIRKAFEEIEHYNPCYTGHRVTLKSCFKRARSLAEGDSHSGLICNNQDAAKVVFLCKTLSDIKAGAESMQSEIQQLKAERDAYKTKFLEAVKMANELEAELKKAVLTIRQYESELNAVLTGPCEWTYDEDGSYETECGEMFIFIDGGPAENHAKYCPYCGKEIKVKE